MANETIYGSDYEGQEVEVKVLTYDFLDNPRALIKVYGVETNELIDQVELNLDEVKYYLNGFDVVYYESEGLEEIDYRDEAVWQ